MKKWLFLLLICCCRISATTSSFDTFKNYSTLDGLPNNDVTTIIQDSKGYLWIGTYDGLCKYDGSVFKLYRNSHKNGILISNRIRTLCQESSKGDIWIGTERGIMYYDTSTETFHAVKHEMFDKELSIISRILPIRKNELLAISVKEGVIILENKKVKEIISYTGSLFKNIPIRYSDAVKLDNENILITSSVGLFIYNFSENKLFPILSSYVKNCTAVAKLNDEQICVAVDNGLVVLRYNKRSKLNSITFEKNLLYNHFITCITVDKDKTVWLGTINDGILTIKADEFDKSNPNFTHYRSQYDLIRIGCILPDAFSGCWIATHDHGIYCFDNNTPAIKQYSADMKYSYAPPINSIINLTAYDDNRAYVITNSEGIYLFDTRAQKFESLPFKISAELAKRIAYMYISKNKTTWLASGGGGFGVYKVLPSSTEVTHLTSTKYPIVNTLTATVIAEDKFGNLLLGTSDDVYKIKLDAKGNVSRVSSLSENKQLKNKNIGKVTTIYSDPSKNCIWIGTQYNGLICISDEKDIDLNEVNCEIYVYDKNNPTSISSNFITSILRLPNNELWIATEHGGLCKAIYENNKINFICYSEDEGLSNNVVKCILPDDMYNLWITTNKGLEQFNTQTTKFYNFQSESLQGSFKGNTAVRLKNGCCILGSESGLCYFYPQNINFDTSIPVIEFGDLRVLNTTISPLDTLNGRIIIDKNLNEAGQIILKSNENVFSIEIVSLMRTNSLNRHIRYKLEPSDETWISLPSESRYVTFSNLPAGEYKLIVQISSIANVWGEPISLQIKILPTFWKSNVAVFIYILVFIILVLVFLFFIFKTNRLQYEILVEKMEKEKIAEINKTKLHIFSNLSHELKTPITIIHSSVDFLFAKYQLKGEINDTLSLVKRQSSKLIRLLEQVLNFQKADTEVLEMNKSDFNLIVKVNELFEDYRLWAEKEGKSVSLLLPPNDIWVCADKEMIEIILNNLINNALKFTNIGDKVTIEINAVGSNIVIKVSDTGVGIDTEILPHIFNYFYRSDLSASLGGTGLGLAYSTLLAKMHNGQIHAENNADKGATFTITLPILINPILSETKINEILEIEVNTPLVVDTNLVISSDEEYVQNDSILIYIVEDNSDMRNLLVNILTSRYLVKSFSNPIQCFEALEKQWPNIIISDVLMPEMNGFDFCRKLKANLLTCHIPLILLTACTTIEDQIKGAEYGADAFITKPFDIRLLCGKIDMMLTRSNRIKERNIMDLPSQPEKEKLSISTQDEAFLSNLYQLLELESSNPEIDLNELARKLFLNRTHFFEKVKCLTGRTPFELIKHYRLQKSQELLSNGSLIADVSIEVGFKNRTHFVKLFKEEFGMTPKEYQNQIKK